MSDPTPGRPTVGELRAYLLTQFNQALRRLGMYGGEDALRLLADALAFADARQPEWNATVAALQTQGAANSAGVRGAFQRVWGDHGASPSDAVASVYAEVALPQGWVTLDRTLDQREYDDLDRPSGRPAPGRPRRARPAGRPPPRPRPAVRGPLRLHLRGRPPPPRGILTP